jgi:feruloyl esterase
VRCQSLAEQRLPDTTISSALEVTTGSFTAPGSTNVIGNLPSFCRVAGVIAPTSESQVLFEAWLPLETWNGKFAGVGNGGWAGTISYAQMADQLRRGYATASTNTGSKARHGEVRL